jgi:hypothetical protein
VDRTSAPVHLSGETDPQARDRRRFAPEAGFDRLANDPEHPGDAVVRVDPVAPVGHDLPAAVDQDGEDLRPADVDPKGERAARSRRPLTRR